jgi:REP element-mobilizing transposase RayT
MARPYRIQSENCFYHITSRGDDRKKIYLSSYDYEKFLEYLKEAKQKYKFYLYAYCLMSNHYHLLIETTQANISKIMHYVNGSYTTYYNIKRHRCGHLFQGRYKSIVVDKDSYLLELSRYIHLNPVRAKIVQIPEKHKWSSCNAYLAKKADNYIDKDRVKNNIDMNEIQYRKFVYDGINNKINPFSQVYAGFLLGSSKFIKEKLHDLKGKIESKDFSYRKDLSVPVDKEELIYAVAKACNKNPEDLCKKNRALPERKIAIYLLKRLTQLTNSEIGEKFGITFSAVSKAAKDVDSLMQQDSKVKQLVGKVISSFKG